jgi:hypothetical protein
VALNGDVVRTLFLLTPDKADDCTSRYLAGGSYLDLRLLFEVPTPSLYRIVRKVVDAVNDEYFNEDLVFPTSNVALLAQIQAGFDAMTGNVMTGCVGAIDGIVIRIQGPSFAESDGNPRQYYNRKGFFGLVCLAVCDSRKKFTSMSMKCPGSTNDNIACFVEPPLSRGAKARCDLARPCGKAFLVRERHFGSLHAAEIGSFRSCSEMICCC